MSTTVQPTATRRNLSLGLAAVGVAGPWGAGVDALRAAATTANAPWAAAPIPQVPGFVDSHFSPLVFEVAQQCLRASAGDPARTAIVLGSLFGDATTFDLTSERMVAGELRNPLLFMQTTPNAVLGYVGNEFTITGPMSSICVSGGMAGELLMTADLLMATSEVDRVLLLGVELATNDRTAHTYQLLSDGGGTVGPPGGDVAVGVLVERAAGPLEITSIGAIGGYAPSTPRVIGREADLVGQVSAEHLLGTAALGGCGSMQGLVHLAVGFLSQGQPGTATLVHDPTARAEQAVIELTYRGLEPNKGSEA